MFGILSAIEANGTIKDWSRLYYFCQKQAIVGLAFGEIEGRWNEKKEKIPEELLYQWIGDTEQIKLENQLLNREVESLAELLDKEKVKYAVVKGQVAATYYQRPELRCSGDVDFYCPSEDFLRAKELIEKEWGLSVEKGKSPYHYHFDRNGVTFEMHFLLYRTYYRRREKYWKELLDNSLGHRVKIGNANVATLQPTVHVLYVFLHLYNHLIQKGVGLKQFYDLGMMLNDNVDKTELRNHLKVLGVARAFNACEYVLTDYIGVSSEYMPYKMGGLDRLYGRKILKEVLGGGNMGSHNNHFWNGCGHLLEAICVKTVHFITYFWLSPKYHVGWMINRIGVLMSKIKERDE